MYYIDIVRRNKTFDIKILLYGTTDCPKQLCLPFDIKILLHGMIDRPKQLSLLQFLLLGIGHGTLNPESNALTIRPLGLP